MPKAGLDLDAGAGATYRSGTGGRRRSRAGGATSARRGHPAWRSPPSSRATEVRAPGSQAPKTRIAAPGEARGGDGCAE